MIAAKCPHIKVIIVDLNQSKIDSWNSSHLPIFEPNLQDIVESQRDKNLFFSSDVDSGILEADLIFVSVNTPTKKIGFGSGAAADMT